MSFSAHAEPDSDYSSYTPNTINTTNDNIMQNPSVVLYGPKTAKIQDAAIPELVDAHDVIVRINYVGVCGSDVRPSPPLSSTTTFPSCSHPNRLTKHSGSLLAPRRHRQNDQPFYRHRDGTRSLRHHPLRRLIRQKRQTR